ncbi:hypothetical protein VSR68_32950 [Paraburkholderia phymatum]|uniref:hypothetical protein n=1 Tax=Paraburkholderia phymatum TaxID=148447 RepID=UPI00317DAADB
MEDKAYMVAYSTPGGRMLADITPFGVSHFGPLDAQNFEDVTEGVTVINLSHYSEKPADSEIRRVVNAARSPAQDG